MKTHFQYRRHKRNDLKHFVEDFLDSIGDVFEEFDWQKPAANLFETKDAFEVELAAPGLEKSDFRIQIIGNHLMVHVKKESEEGEERITVKRGFNSSNFSKRIRLPEHIDRDQIKARYKKGILTIILPKLITSEEEPGTEIPVD